MTVTPYKHLLSRERVSLYYCILEALIQIHQSLGHFGSLYFAIAFVYEDGALHLLIGCACMCTYCSSPSSQQEAPCLLMGDSPACLCSWLAGGKCELAISSCCIWQLQQVFQQTSSASSGEGSLLPKVFQLLKMVWEYFINFEWHGNWLTLLYLLCYGSSCVSSLLLYCHLVLWLPNVILAVIFLMLLTILLFFFTCSSFMGQILQDTF